MRSAIDSDATSSTPHCYNMAEHPSAAAERARLQSSSGDSGDNLNPELSAHIMYGLAYTIGSALGCSPPSVETCLEAFLVENKASLTAGSRAWSKHSHRSRSKMIGKDGETLHKTNINKTDTDDANVISQNVEHERCDKELLLKAEAASVGWWGIPSGPVGKINENSVKLFWKIVNGATWRNLHWLPHQVLVYEVRVPAGYGMRWSQDRSANQDIVTERPWNFRGFLEPQMENGHEVGWRH